MMNKIKIRCLLLFLLAMFIGQACYKIDKREYLNITFNDSKISSTYLKMFIDGTLNSNLKVPDSILFKFSGVNALSMDERLIYFKKFPEEWYLISFAASPCWIEYVYNRNFSADPINQRNALEASQLKRIEDRFRKEVLEKAEIYAKQHHVPDSILYILNLER